MAVVSRTRALGALLAASILVHAGPGVAGPFDVIMIERPVFTLCPGCGVWVSGVDFALVVNTGAEDISEATLLGATFTVTSSSSQVRMRAFPNVFRNPVGPVRPREAVGRVQPMNQMMLNMLDPGETFRNSGPLFGLQVDVTGSWDGPVLFDIRMRMGDHEYVNGLIADVRAGPVPDVWFTAAGRGSAFPVVTPTTSTTWGAIKATYR